MLASFDRSVLLDVASVDLIVINHHLTLAAAIIRRCAFGPSNLGTVGRNRLHLIESRLNIDISNSSPRLHMPESGSTHILEGDLPTFLENSLISWKYG